MPCTARIAISQVIDPASPASADAATKITMLATKMVLRP